MSFEFSPTSSQAGTVGIAKSYPEVIWTGGGTYSVQGSDPEKLKIVGDVSMTASTIVATASYVVAIDINLTPLKPGCK